MFDLSQAPNEGAAAIPIQQNFEDASEYKKFSKPYQLHDYGHIDQMIRLQRQEKDGKLVSRTDTDLADFLKNRANAAFGIFVADKKTRPTYHTPNPTKLVGQITMLDESNMSEKTLNLLKPMSPEGTRSALIGGLVVLNHKDCRGKGLMPQLLEACEFQAHARVATQVDFLYAFVLKSNQDPVKSFVKYGFKKVGKGVSPDDESREIDIYQMDIRDRRWLLEYPTAEWRAALQVQEVTTPQPEYAPADLQPQPA